MSYGEVNGSRKAVKTGKRTMYVVIGVSDDGAGGPEVGGLYLTETGVMAHRCTRVNETPEVIPGLWFHEATYEAFVAYAA